jgi:hypothetical protein
MKVLMLKKLLYKEKGNKKNRTLILMSLQEPIPLVKMIMLLTQLKNKKNSKPMLIIILLKKNLKNQSLMN